MMYMDNERFIYVFSNKSRDELLGRGYKLLKSYSDKTIYIFENSNTKKFNLDKTEYATSNVMTF